MEEGPVDENLGPHLNAFIGNLESPGENLDTSFDLLEHDALGSVYPDESECLLKHNEQEVEIQTVEISKIESGNEGQGDINECVNDEEFTKWINSEGATENSICKFISIVAMPDVGIKELEVADVDRSTEEVKESSAVVECKRKSTRQKLHNKVFHSLTFNSIRKLQKRGVSKLTRNGGSRKPYKCKICEYKCTTSNKLKVHMYKHTGSKPHECNICEYKCTTSSNLKKHMAKHTGEKPFHCNFCEYKCVSSSNLKKHMYKHTGNLPFQCDVCEYKCTGSVDLSRHMYKHTGEKPYKCDVCEYKCTASNNLKRHMLIHTGNKPHECNICDYKCVSSSNLTKHMSKHTGRLPLNSDVCEYTGELL